MVFAHELVAQAERLILIWDTMRRQLRSGGTSAKEMRAECKLLAELIEATLNSLGHRSFASNWGSFVALSLDEHRISLDAMLKEVRALLTQIDKPVRIQAEPAMLDQLVQQATAQQTWQPLKEVVAHLRKQELPAKE